MLWSYSPREQLNINLSYCCSFCGSSRVSLEVFSPTQILLIVQTTAMRHSVFSFSSFSIFLQFRIQKSVVICSFCSYFLFPVFCFLPLFIHFISWSPLFSFQICYFFFSLFVLLYSVCFSLMFFFYLICSLSISLHLVRSLYLILLCYVFCSCFCFHCTSSFW